MQEPGFLDRLQRAADAAGEAEAEFRRTISARIAALEQERSFAFRRLNLMRMLAETAGAADSEASAVGACRAALCGRLGWTGESAAQKEALSAFEPVARALRQALAAEKAADAGPEGGNGEETGEETDAPADPAAALSAFEDWYARSRGTPFWVLFEHHMPETPLVDF